MPVDALGTLRIDAPTGRSLELAASGDTLRVDVPGWQELRAMVPRSYRLRSGSIRALAKIFSTYGLTLRVESAGEAVIELGQNARANWLARLLGLGPTRLRLVAIARVVARG